MTRPFHKNADCSRKTLVNYYDDITEVVDSIGKDSEISIYAVSKMYTI